MKYSEIVSLNSRFIRSINIEKDIADESLLSGFICPRSSESAILNIANNVAANGQASFTWTGPYGSGKSSLVLLLSAILSKNKGLRQTAQKIVSAKTYKEIQGSLGLKNGWDVLPIICEPKDPFELLRQHIECFKFGKNITTREKLFQALSDIAAGSDGLILFFDEMGKVLEAAARGEADVYFFQQLAEFASRSNGKIVLIGILHQAFTEYARSLPHTTRDEWVKIQGRFVDMPINAAGEEQIELIGRAIVSAKKPKSPSETIKKVVKTIARHRPINENHLADALNNCWPLDPVVACLLGPVSKRKWGQNQRSIFSFLNSAEPEGFRDFLKLEDCAADALYKPHRYFDYLRDNFEPLIVASSDSRLWSIALDAISRAEAKGFGVSHINLLKTIAVIDIFKGTASGLSPTVQVLAATFGDTSRLVDILRDLQKISVIIYKKHTDSYSIFEGSDFDLDSALREAFSKTAEVDVCRLSKLANFKPVVAKRYYHEYGAMRWFNVAIAPIGNIEEFLQHEKADSTASGLFAIFLPFNASDAKRANELIRQYRNEHGFPVLFAVAKESYLINGYSKELLALEWIYSNKSELSADSVARREIEGRIAATTALLEGKLSEVLMASNWHMGGEQLGRMSSAQLSALASKLCSTVYRKSPRIKSELLNRKRASASANSALNELLRSMILKEGEPDLGIDGYPPEKGLFKILLEETGIYRAGKEGYTFAAPKPGDAHGLANIWAVTDDVIKKSDRAIRLDEIYRIWSLPPYGIKSALHPFFAVAYLLTRKDSVALYRDGFYVTKFDDLIVDYLLKAPDVITLRWAELDTVSEAILSGILGAVNDVLPTKTLPLKSSPLEVSRHVVSIVYELHPWVLKTRELSKTTIRFREMVKSAKDPNKMLFDDLGDVFLPGIAEASKTPDAGVIVEGFKKSMAELLGAYPNAMSRIGTLVTSELEVLFPSPQNLKKLNERAKKVAGTTGDFRLDAFASRLSTFSGTLDDIAGLVSLANSKPSSEWIDLDIQNAQAHLIAMCSAFKKAELYTKVKNRHPSRYAVAFISGKNGSPITSAAEFDILEEHAPEISKLKDKILKSAKTFSSNEKLILAALAELGMSLAEHLKEKSVIN
jgi:hypothetical protein